MMAYADALAKDNTVTDEAKALGEIYFSLVHYLDFKLFSKRGMNGGHSDPSFTIWGLH